MKKRYRDEEKHKKGMKRLEKHTKKESKRLNKK